MIVVEVLGRRGEVLERVRIASLPATIGRAWTSEVVLSDPTVDPEHARIVADETGALALEDLGSVNGTYDERGPGRAERIALDGNTLVRVGRTPLRIVRGDLPVPAAVPDVPEPARLRWLLESPLVMGLLAVGGLLLVMLVGWLSSYESKVWASVGAESLLVLLLASVWAGIWSVVTRVRMHQFRFFQHFALTWLALISLEVIAVLFRLADYLYPSGWLLESLELGAGLLVMILLIVAQLRLAGILQPRIRAAIAIALTGAMAGLLLITQQAAESDFLPESVSISSALAPLPPGVVPATTIENMLRETDAMKRQLDLRAK